MLVRLPQRLMVAALALAIGSDALTAQTAVTWTQGVTGNWNVFGNWAGLIPPDPFPNNGANTYTVTIPGVAGQANTTTVIFDNTTIAGNAITVSGLTLSSALNASGNNSAELVLGAGVTLSAGNLTNFSGTTLSGGRYFIDGTLRFNGANVQTLAAGTTLIMNGPAAQILNQANNVNALAGFKTNAGTFDIRNGYNFSAATGWNNSGIVSVSEGSVFSTAGNFTNSGTLLASGFSGNGTISLNNTVMTNAAGTLNAGNNGEVHLANSTVNGGTLTTSGNGRITFSNSAGNNLSNVTLAGNADLTSAAVASTRVTNGLVFGAGGVFNLNNGGVVSFSGDNAVSGTGTIVFGGAGANKVAIDFSNSTLTLGAGVTIRGENGIIGVQHFNGTANSTIVNNGLISADVNLGTITIGTATVSNNNILEGKNGGTLTLSSNVNNSASGQVRATNNGVVHMNGSTITGGALNTTTGGRITATNSSTNTLNGVTVNGAIDLASNLSAVRVVNGITFGGGSVSINNASGLVFTGNTSTAGTGSITFGTDAGNQVAVDGSNSTFTIGSGTLIHGQNGSVGAQRFVGTANSTVANNGTISADVNGGKITLIQASVANNNVLEAKNGGTLDIQTNVSNTASGKLNANNSGVIMLNGYRISGGTINTSSGGRFAAAYNGNNFVNDVTVNGGIDLATTLGAFTVGGATGLTLNAGATVNIDQASVVAFRGAQTLSGAGAVVFGSNGGGQVAVDASNSVFTVAAGATIRGHTGIIGQQFLIGTANSSIANNGRISADVNGGTIEIKQASVVNNGILEAKNGGTLLLSSNVAGTAGSQIAAGAGSVVVQNGVVLSGVINSTGTGSLRPTQNGGNFLDGVTLTGTLDLASNQGSERVVNGLVLNGTVNLDNSSVFTFQNTQSLTGNGTVVFGSTAGNILGVDASNSVLTIGAAAKIRGENGVVGSQVYIGTANSSILNNGRISADVAGGTIEMTQASVVNNGIMEALNGGTLKLSSNISGTSTGQFAAGANSVILQNGVSVTGTINSSGSGAFKATNNGANFFDGVKVNGSVDLASSVSSERIVNGLTLNGAINLNQNSTLAFQGTQTLSGSGTITLGASPSNLVAVDGSNSVLTIGPSVLIHGENGTVGAQAYLGTANSTLLNNGRIAADVSGGTITLAQALFANNSILEARNGGTLNITTNVTNSTTGQVNAHDNGIALLNSATLTGGSINTSNGGAFRATNSAGNFMNGVTVNGNVDLAHATSSVRVSGGMTLGGAGVVNVNMASALVFNGNNALNGTGTVVFGASAGNVMAIDGSNSTLTIGAGVSVRGAAATIGSQQYVGTANSHLINNGSINSDGGGVISIAAGQLADVVNNGTFRAQNGTFNNGLTVTGTGTLQVDATGVMNMANAGGANVQNKLMMGAAGATLNTNNRNITINEDYTNVGAGTGNAFNRRAGINGTGQIFAGGNVAQAISGANVSNGATTNATMTIGNVRVGTTTYGYNVVNNGTVGPSLRGAIQTSVNGANISDARLSGAGVTASNYGPTLLGGSYGPLNVDFTAASAGALAPLSGQTVNLRSNFENLADQKLNIVLGAGAAAYNAAVGSAAAPIALGNTRVGGTLAGNVAVSNTAPSGNFSEKLDATFGANTGNVSNNGGSISLLTAGTSNNTSMGVSLNTATSGAKSGTATLNYVSNGTGTSGLASIAAGSQAVTVNGNVYQVAAGQLNGTALNFGTVQVGQSVSQVLSITNSATGAAGFVEDLNASFGAKSGSGSTLFSGSGAINGLLAGATNNSAMTVSVNTSAAGTVNGSIDVNYFSAGAVNNVSNGLGVLAVGSAPFGVTGNIQAAANVVNQASPVINNAPINLGNVRINAASPTGFVSVTNQATAPPQAALNATIVGSGSITATGSFNLLNPGATNASNLQVGMNTSTAGAKNGTATIGFVSDASNIGNCAPNCQLTLASQAVAVNGAVYRLANPTLTGSPVNLVARVGDAAPTATIGVTNTSADAFTERLDASFNGVAPTGFTTSGVVTGLAAQASSTALKVGLNTSAAGAFSGSAGINLISSGAGTTGAADFALAQGNAAVNGKVYAAAVGQLNTSAVNFGIVHVGDVVGAQNASVTNGAAPVALNDVLTGDITGGSGPFAVAGTLGSGVTAGSTDNSSLSVGLSTANAGVYSGSGSVNFKSHNADMADLALGSASVAFSGTVNNYAAAAFAKSAGAGSFNFSNGGWVLDFGAIQAGSSNISATLGVRNSATGPADDLNGDFAFGGGTGFGFTGFNQFTGIGAGSLFANLGVLLNTSTVGMFSQTVSLGWFGSNASGYIGDTNNLQLTVTGNVTSIVTPPVTAVPEPSTFVLMCGGLAFVAWARKRRGSR